MLIYLFLHRRFIDVQNYIPEEKVLRWITKEKKTQTSVRQMYLRYYSYKKITANASSLEIILFCARVILFIVYRLPIVLDNGLVFRKEVPIDRSCILPLNENRNILAA